MEIDHKFKFISTDLYELFDGVDTLGKFEYRLEKQAKNHSDRYDPNDYLGDGFEFFVEMLYKIQPFNILLGEVSGYHLLPTYVEDKGLDALCYNKAGFLSGVQIKYKSKKDSVLTSNKDKLANGTNQAQDEFEIHSSDECSTYYIITNCKGLHHHTENKMLTRAKCISREDIKLAVDKNIPFWNYCRKICTDFKDHIESLIENNY